jgi:hypothetical protein
VAEKPKIICIDIPDVSKPLKEAGYNVRWGTWGTPFVNSSEYKMLRLAADLPNYHEQEVVFADLKSREAQYLLDPPGPATSLRVPKGTCDPRPFAMNSFRGESQRILEHGGIFICLAAAVRNAVYLKQDRTPVKQNNWDILQELGRTSIVVDDDSGDEIAVVPGTPYAEVLRRHLSGSTYSCHFSFPTAAAPWQPLMLNKYQQPVAALLEVGRGRILLLPRFSDFKGVAFDLLADVLPRTVPHLFPVDESAAWLSEPQYELPGVVGLREQIAQVRAAAAEQEAALAARIDHERSAHGYLHTLLVGTGDSLVEAVHHAFQSLGFDAQFMDAERGQADRREDLRIDLDGAVLLVEVKGIAGTGGDEDWLAVSKYLATAMRELSRTDVRGLAVVNHQRGEIPSNRAQRPMRDVVLQAATRDHCGLMTTWTLYRLTRNATRLGWTRTAIEPLIKTDGEVLPVPAHYERLGVVEKRWSTVLGVALDGKLQVGDRIAVDDGVDYYEQTVESLQVDKKHVQFVEAGALVGIATAVPSTVRKGCAVYRVVALGLA